jgi:prefoldin alpha subunit
MKQRKKSEKMAEEKKQQIKLTEPQLVNAFSAERANLEALQTQLADVQAFLRELLAAKDSLTAIKKSKEKEKIIVPLGAGYYIDAMLDNNANVKASLAGGAVLNNTIEEALKAIEEKKQDTERTIANMQSDQERILTNLNSLSRLLNTLEQKKKQEQK